MPWLLASPPTVCDGGRPQTGVKVGVPTGVASTHDLDGDRGAPHSGRQRPRGPITLWLNSCLPPMCGYGGGITTGDSYGRDCREGKVKGGAP
jgi:hypothetical protein